MRLVAIVLLSILVLPLVSGCRSRAADVRIIRNVAYGTDAQQTLDAYLPSSGSARRPALIWIHGGYWHNNADAAAIEKWCAHWAGDLGYPSFSIRYRRSPDHRYPDAVTDVLSAMRHIQSRSKAYGIAPDRTVLIGVSAGGHLALLAALSDPKTLLHGKQVIRPRGAVSFAGPTDLIRLSSHDGRARAMTAEFIGGPVGKMASKYRDASPITHVSKDDPPTLLVHGTDDQTIPYSQSVGLRKAMNGAGVRCTLISISGGRHGSGFQDPFDGRIVGGMLDYLRRVGCAVK